MATAPKPPPRPLPRKTEQAASTMSSSASEDKENAQKFSELERELRRKEEEILSLTSQIVGAETYPEEHIYSTLGEVNNNLIGETTQEIDVLLIGKTGNGKSAVGNTILGYDAFKSLASLESVTNYVTYNVSEWNGYRIKVVDGPGVGDTRMDTNEATQVILKAMAEAISLSPEGFHALLLVVRFGGRFTAEDQLTVTTLKKIFGEHFFRKFCILVMTCGDKFEEEENTNFQEWVKRQSNAIFTELLKECNGRIVLINNKIAGKEKKKRQLEELVKVIESLKRQNCRYSDEHFSTALQTRNELLVESQKEFIEEEIMNEAKLIQRKLQRILNEEKIHKSATLLQTLYEEADALYKRIGQSDKETGVLKTLVNHVWSIMRSIRDQIKLSETMLKETRRLKSERDDQAVRHATELRLQREEFDKLVLEGKRKEDEKLQMLQKQIDQLNEIRREWEEEDIQLNIQAQDQWDVEKEKVQNIEADIKELNTKTLRLVEKKVFTSVLAKLKNKFFSKKRSSHLGESES